MCKYALLFPIWLAFIVHQLMFSSHFAGLRECKYYIIPDICQLYDILISMLKFRTYGKVRKGF